MIALVVVLSLCAGAGTGCSNPIESQMADAGVAAVSAGQDDMAYAQDYLSEDICIIPKEQQSQKDSEITAGAALLINDSDKQMLYAQKIYSKRYPASITKIVTALVALKYGNMSDTVTVSYKASHITEYGAKICGFQEGDRIKLKDLLTCFLVYSGNDAGIAIAEHIAGSTAAFAEMMNQEMQELGASGSHFVNPHGLHRKKHYTTAYDLYLVFHELLQYKRFQEIIALKEFTVTYQDKDGEEKANRFTSTNQYLTGYSLAPEGITVVGGKTGTTLEAGSCLILYVQDESGKDYIAVILKADSSYSLYQQMNHMLEKITSPEGNSTDSDEQNQDDSSDAVSGPAVTE